jgi:hypothetical protein
MRDYKTKSGDHWCGLRDGARHGKTIRRLGLLGRFFGMVNVIARTLSSGEGDEMRPHDWVAAITAAASGIGSRPGALPHS